jgi:hypothetical protein
VVVVAYYFPPVIGIASARAEALTRHLGDFGWEPVVVTVRDAHYHRADWGESEVAVVRTRSLELSRFFRRAYGLATNHPEPADDAAIRSLEPGGVGGALRRVARNYAYVPDAQVGWIPFAARAASNLLDAPSTQGLLFSSSVPYSAHFAAMRAAARCGVPWVAELRDPWFSGREADPARSRLRRRLDRFLEDVVISRADHVVLTSEGTRADLLAAFPHMAADRFSVVRNGFEPIPEGKPPDAAEPMTILYAGTVAPGEDMTPVLESLDAVHHDHPGAFRLRVLGPGDSWNTTGRPWLELLGTVSFAAARTAMADSSALLLVQLHGAYRRIIPGKAFEYIGVRRPILGLVPRDSEMEALLVAHADVRLVGSGPVDDLGAAVRELLREHRAGSLQAPRVARSTIAHLERREQARQLAEIFERVGEQRDRGLV